jgi:hypothetical protein
MENKMNDRPPSMAGGFAAASFVAVCEKGSEAWFGGKKHRITECSRKGASHHIFAPALTGAPSGFQGQKRREHPERYAKLFSPSLVQQR